MAFAAPSRPAARICSRCRLQLQQQPTRALTSNRRRLPEIAKVAKVAKVANTAAQSADDNAEAGPRWARTPSAMKAPFRVNPMTKNDAFAVNNDPQRLDEAYIKILGKDGDKWLPEEVKWLAVTHKSFDHGRRGFNDRLAFLGRRIIELQTSLAMLDAPPNPSSAASATGEDAYGRIAFQHPALSNIENVTGAVKEKSLGKERLAQLAQRYGLASVMRWKPKQVRNLQASGIDAVLTHTMFAIIGAVALQRGGEIANQVAREKILAPLGLI